MNGCNLSLELSLTFTKRTQMLQFPGTLQIGTSTVLNKRSSQTVYKDLIINESLHLLHDSVERKSL